MTKIINLKDYSDIYVKDEIDYKFLEGFVTNSRLMGVVGVRLHFASECNKNLTLFFHLDFEEYGFDRFEVYDSDDYETVDRITQSMMGGLGSVLVPITLEGASSLIYFAVEVGTAYSYDIPLDFFEYEYLLDDFYEEVSDEIYDIICSKIRSDEELINYFIMRTVGMDYTLRNYKLGLKHLGYFLVEEPTVLLKNEITKVREGRYIAKSILDHFDAYKMIISEFEVKENKIVLCKKVDEMVMTSKEAAFQLNKKEHLIVFYVESPLEFKIFLERVKPELLKNIYESGSLYTEFHKTNNHVNDETYYLNGDVYGTYYVTDEHHLIISCFDKKDLSSIKLDLLEEFSKINILAELEADMPILYNFVTSSYLNFFEFLGD